MESTEQMAGKLHEAKKLLAVVVSERRRLEFHLAQQQRVEASVRRDVERIERQMEEVPRSHKVAHPEQQAEAAKRNAELADAADALATWRGAFPYWGVSSGGWRCRDCHKKVGEGELYARIREHVQTYCEECGKVRVSDWVEGVRELIGEEA